MTSMLDRLATNTTPPGSPSTAARWTTSAPSSLQPARLGFNTDDKLEGNAARRFAADASPPLSAAFVGATPPPRRAANPPGANNEFRHHSTNTNPVPVGGNIIQQGYQTWRQGRLTGMAALYGSTQGVLPVSIVLRGELKTLTPNPPTSGPAATAEYKSRIPGVSPAAAYAHFVNNPTAVFGAAGLTLAPACAKLQDGAKVFLFQPGPPPVLAPVQVRLDPGNLTVSLATLDGHPLRGTNTFKFTSDGAGGTRMVQTSRFQLSSVAGKLGEYMGALEQQVGIWKAVHGQVFAATRGAG